MALHLTEIPVGYSEYDAKKHIAECHGCGFPIQYDSQAGVYDSHTLATCLLFLRPFLTKPDFMRTEEWQSKMLVRVMEMKEAEKRFFAEKRASRS